MSPRRGGICGRRTQDLPSTRLQGGEARTSPAVAASGASAAVSVSFASLGSSPASPITSSSGCSTSALCEDPRPRYQTANFLNTSEFPTELPTHMTWLFPPATQEHPRHSSPIPATEPQSSSGFPLRPRNSATSFRSLPGHGSDGTPRMWCSMGRRV